MKANFKRLLGLLTALLMITAALPCGALAEDATSPTAISWSGAFDVVQDPAESSTGYALKIGEEAAVGSFEIAAVYVLTEADVYVPTGAEFEIKTTNGSTTALATATLEGGTVHVAGEVAEQGFGTYENDKWVNVKLLQNTQNGEYNVYVNNRAILLLEARGTAGTPAATEFAASDKAYVKNVKVSSYTPVENRIRTVYKSDVMTLAPKKVNDVTVVDSYFFYAGEDVNTAVENAKHIRIKFNAVQSWTGDANRTAAFWVGLAEDSAVNTTAPNVRNVSDGTMFKIVGDGKVQKGGTTSQTMDEIGFSTKDNTAADYVIDIVADEEDASKAAVTVRVGDEIAVRPFTCGGTVTLRDCRNFVFQVDTGSTKSEFTFKDISVEVVSSASAVYFEDFESTNVGDEPAGFTKYSTNTDELETFTVESGARIKSWTSTTEGTAVTGNSTNVAEFYQPQYTERNTKRYLDGGTVEDESIGVLASGTAETVYLELPDELKGQDNLRLSFNLYNPLNSIAGTGVFTQKLRIGFANEIKAISSDDPDGHFLFVISNHGETTNVRKQQFTVKGSDAKLAFPALEWGNLTMETAKTYDGADATGYNITAYGRAGTATRTDADTGAMNYLVMQIPHDNGGKYYLDNILVEAVCDADEFVGEAAVVAESDIAPAEYTVKKVTTDSAGIVAVTIEKRGTLSPAASHTLYLAVYDDGKLQNVAVTNLSQGFTGTEKTLTFDKSLSGGKTYRIFILDEKLAPMMATYTQPRQ